MATRKPYSRLARREQRRLVRQTVILSVSAIVVIAVFIFLILPSFIKIINVILGDTSQVEYIDEIPPQAPVISAPVDATSSARLKVNGFSEPKSQVVFVVNGEKGDQVEAEDDGSFSHEINLKLGENKFRIYAIDEAGNESQTTKEYVVMFDNVPPVLEITSPGEGAEVVGKNNQNLVITGETDPDAKVIVAGKLSFPNSEGLFSYTHRLEEGENSIEIKSEDESGNTTVVILSVSFKP